MRSARRLCCTLVAIFGMTATAMTQQGKENASSAASARPANVSAPAADSAEASPEEQAPFIASLPIGVDPNPPDPSYLKAEKLTWKGEYESDKKGRPVLDEAGKPVPVLYNKKGKRQRSHVRIPKTSPALIVDGALLVDGWTSKARLNYDIQDLHYLYISVPSLGTLIVSPTPFPGSSEEKDAFTEKALTIMTSGHEIQLITSKPVLGKKTPEPAYVKLDDGYTADRRSPILGYGRKLEAPYVWPGAVAGAQDGVLDPPPLPADMRPKMAAPICIAQTGKACPAKSSSSGMAGPGGTR